MENCAGITFIICPAVDVMEPNMLYESAALSLCVIQNSRKVSDGG